MKVGILGGTFDPVHRGHLALAKTALEQLGLDKVLFVPARDPWMKTGRRRIAPARHRLAMLRLALKGKPGFEVSTVDLERPGKTYAVDTVAAVRKELGVEAGLYFIMGADSLTELHQWKEPGKLAAMCRLAVAGRPRVSAPDVARLEKMVPGIGERIVFLNMAPVDASSTEIRERLKSGRSAGRAVPAAVVRYISDNRL
ncbi:MAG: nicotinate-nucleotide adenylyltransferase [Chloroflexota bacterium]